MLILHDYFRSSASYRVRIALNVKGVLYERRSVDLRIGEQSARSYLSVNPAGLVPALEAPGLVLTQSLAIVDWLEATYPDPVLFPKEPVARARALSQAASIACDIHPLNNLRVLNRLGTQFGADQGMKDVWYRHWLAEGLSALEASVGDGPYLGGTAPNIADVFLVPQMYNARRYALPMEPYPKLVAADALACAIPSFAEAHPDREAA